MWPCTIITYGSHKCHALLLSAPHLHFDFIDFTFCFRLMIRSCDSATSVLARLQRATIRSQSACISFTEGSPAAGQLLPGGVRAEVCLSRASSWACESLNAAFSLTTWSAAVSFWAFVALSCCNSAVNCAIWASFSASFSSTTLREVMRVWERIRET